MYLVKNAFTSSAFIIDHFQFQTCQGSRATGFRRGGDPDQVHQLLHVQLHHQEEQGAQLAGRQVREVRLRARPSLALSVTLPCACIFFYGMR